MKHKIKIIVFDLDGTLADSMPKLKNHALRVIKQHSPLHIKRAREMYNTKTGIPFRRMIDEYLLLHEPDELRQLIKEKYEKNKQKIRLGCLPFPHTQELLQTLSKKYTLVISASSKPAQIQQYVDAYGIRNYFKHILGSVGTFEKGREHIRFLQNEENVKTQEIIFISDSVIDLYRAQECNIHFIGKKGLFFKKSSFASNEKLYPVINAWSELHQYIV